MMAAIVTGSPLWPGMGSLDGGACDITPGRRAMSDDNSRQKERILFVVSGLSRYRNVHHVLYSAPFGSMRHLSTQFGRQQLNR